MSVSSIFSMKISPKVTFSHFLGCHTIFEHDPHGTKTILIIPKNVNKTTISPIIRGHRTQRLTHLLARQYKHVWQIVRQLPMKNGWWDAPFTLLDLAVSNLHTIPTNVLPSWLIAHYNILHMLILLQCSQFPYNISLFMYPAGTILQELHWLPSPQIYFNTLELSVQATDLSIR